MPAILNDLKPTVLRDIVMHYTLNAADVDPDQHQHEPDGAP